MSVVTYKLKQRLRTIGKGVTETRMGRVEAVVKKDHNEAPGEVYSEIVAYRLASLALKPCPARWSRMIPG